MTRQASAFLRYLKSYLDQKEGRNAALRKFYFDTTKKVLHHPHLWKHINGHVQPNLETSLVYMVFLHQACELIPSKIPGELFRFKHPEWIK